MFIKKLDEHLASAIADAGYETPTILEKKCISKIKSGADLVCIAPENSGRTTTIVISVIQKLKAALNDVPRALIFVRDEEQAQLMKEQFKLLLGKNCDLRVFTAHEKRKIEDIKDYIYAGSDVVIGTSKRLGLLYSSNGINLNDLKMFIIDDADLIMRHEILSQVDRLSDVVTKTQHILFASRVTERIERFAEKFMNVSEIDTFEE